MLDERANGHGAVHSRFECKYLLAPSLVPELREWLRPFVRPDDHAAAGGRPRYRVTSLYLDAPDLALYRQTMDGEKKRFKLRVRTYGEGDRGLAFVEIKHKLGDVVHKRRAALVAESARKILAGAPPDRFELDAVQREVVDDFLHRMERLAARPVVRVGYEREAYESAGAEPVRVTLDTDLVHAPSFGVELGTAGGRWTPTPVEGTVVEIKFTERYPDWIGHLVQTFGLRRCSVPKYVLSVNRMLAVERRSVGHPTPPRALDGI